MSCGHNISSVYFFILYKENTASSVVLRAQQVICLCGVSTRGRRGDRGRPWARRIPAQSLTLLLTKEMTMKVKTNVKAGVAAYYYYRVQTMQVL
jgi:hypothetical protein